MEKLKLNIEKIARERKRRKWTYQDLADRMGCTPQHAQHVANSEKVNFETVNKLAEVFDLDPKDLLI